MWETFLSLIVDLVVPVQWKNRYGEVDSRWFLVGVIVVFGLAAAVVFGILFLLGAH